MRLVFAGTPEVAVPALDALVASHHDVVAVVTRPDAPAGRGRRLTPSPVHSDADIDTLVTALSEIWSQCALARRAMAA